MFFASAVIDQAVKEVDSTLQHISKLPPGTNPQLAGPAAAAFGLAGDNLSYWRQVQRDNILPCLLAFEKEKNTPKGEGKNQISK